MVGETERETPNMSQNHKNVPPLSKSVADTPALYSGTLPDFPVSDFPRSVFATRCRTGADDSFYSLKHAVSAGHISPAGQHLMK